MGYRRLEVSITAVETPCSNDAEPGLQLNTHLSVTQIESRDNVLHDDLRHGSAGILYGR